MWVQESGEPPWWASHLPSRREDAVQVDLPRLEGYIDLQGVAVVDDDGAKS